MTIFPKSKKRLMMGLKMTEEQVFDYLQSMLPNGLQFVDPYQDEVPQPKGDWAQMNVLDRQNIGLSQRKTDFVDTGTGEITFAYDIQRIYEIQFDFYGENAYDNAGIYQQTLQVNLCNDENEQMCFKTIGSVENRTFLQENKKYQRRYGFDLTCFVIDTIQQESPYFDKIIATLKGYGK